jgi:hypothetical protein
MQEIWDNNNIIIIIIIIIKFIIRHNNFLIINILRPEPHLNFGCPGNSLVV